MSLNNLALGDKIIIYDIDKSYITFFEGLIEEKNILFQSIFEYNNEIFLKIDSIHKFIIFSNNGEIQGNFKITSYIKEGRRNFYLGEINNIKQQNFQIQQAKKEIVFSCNLPYKITLNDNKKNKIQVYCIIKEISIKKFRFLTNYFLNEDDNIEVKFDVSDEFFHAFGKIEKYQNIPKSNYKNQYTVEFYDINFLGENILTKYFEVN